MDISLAFPGNFLVHTNQRVGVAAFYATSIFFSK